MEDGWTRQRAKRYTRSTGPVSLYPRTRGTAAAGSQRTRGQRDGGAVASSCLWSSPALFARARAMSPSPLEQKRKQRLTVSLSAFSLRSLSCGSSRSPLWAELRVFCRPSMEAGEVERGGGVSSCASAARERAKEKAAPRPGASTGGPAVRRGPSYLGPRGGGRA